MVKTKCRLYERDTVAGVCYLVAIFIGLARPNRRILLLSELLLLLLLKSFTFIIFNIVQFGLYQSNFHRNQQNTE